MDYTGIRRLLQRELYRKSFYEFVKAFWHCVEPHPFVDGFVPRFYCELFQYMCRDWVEYKPVKVILPEIKEDEILIDVREGKRCLSINVPPRHTKSMIFNKLGPVWLWTWAPVKAASISHTQGLAAQMNMGRQTLLNSEDFQNFFPEIHLVANSGTFLKDDRGGELYSLNRNAMTGYGGDIIINDDLTNAEAARKDKAEMESAWAYYQNTMPSRINDINKCIIINIQQRLAPNDITGHIMNDAKLSAQYTFVTLPAVFEKTTYIVLPISGEVVKFEKGSYLWPERFGDYEALKAQVGTSIFETQYLQKPVASDKTVFKPDMIIEKDETECPSIDQADMIYASHDFPVKDKESSDFLGSVLAYKVGSNVYIMDCLEKKMAFVKSVEYVKQLDNYYPGIIQVIEDKANGSPILQQLQDEVSGLRAYQPGTNSKMQRAESSSLYISNVIFVRKFQDTLLKTYRLTESLNNLKNRLLSFPFVEHDDIVDAFTQLILYVFMDRKYMVYGRSFNEHNIVDYSTIEGIQYTTVFFNKEGDIWKAAEIGVKYGKETILIVKRELQFKDSVERGFERLKQEFGKSVFIDCSATDALIGMTHGRITIEKYTDVDFDSSVAKVNLALAKNKILIDKSCGLMKGDIESFKFTKSKDETVKYVTEKDGFVACLRLALKYYGGVV